MTMKTINDIRALAPCYDPTRYLPENWQGTALDILRVKECPAVDRLWVVLHEDWIDERTVRLFACDCAEHVLHLFEAKYPDDKRPRQAIEVSRRYANGEATNVELSAARDAAWDARAAWDAARAAARDAARAAAWNAAWAAAWDAWDAAWDAGNAEAEWQVNRLVEILDGVK